MVQLSVMPQRIQRNVDLKEGKLIQPRLTRKEDVSNNMDTVRYYLQSISKEAAPLPRKLKNQVTFQLGQQS